MQELGRAWDADFSACACCRAFCAELRAASAWPSIACTPFSICRARSRSATASATRLAAAARSRAASDAASCCPCTSARAACSTMHECCYSMKFD